MLAVLATNVPAVVISLYFKILRSARVAAVVTSYPFRWFAYEYVTDTIELCHWLPRFAVNVNGWHLLLV